MSRLSQFAQPSTDLYIRHGTPLDAFANARVARQIECSEARIGFVPDLRRQLVPTKRILKLLLVLRAVSHQPVDARISDATAESEIETPSGLVDKIVHVA